MKPNNQFEYTPGKNTPLEEKQWVRRVREEGDCAAFEKIFRTYYKQLHRFAYTYVCNQEKSEDIVQTIFFKIWLNKEDWDPPGLVKHYLFNAVRNEALNVIRHEKIQDNSKAEVKELFRELKSEKYQEQSSQLDELKEAIQREIESLPDRCREIYLLNRRAGLTYKEIANYLDISINTVGTQMGRALKILRKNLSDFLPIYIATSIARLLL